MLLQTQHLSKAFGGVYALRDIGFSIREGEIHGLVGENGAGKSTLIKLLTGVYQMQEGAVLWEAPPVAAWKTPTGAWNTPPGWAGWTGVPCAAGSRKRRTAWASLWTFGKRRQSSPRPSERSWRSSGP